MDVMGQCAFIPEDDENNRRPKEKYCHLVDKGEYGGCRTLLLLCFYFPQTGARLTKVGSRHLEK